MALRNSAARYGAVAQTLHWLTAVLVLVAFIEGVGGNEARVYSRTRASQLAIHETLGMALFGLILLRVLWRLIDPPPRTHPGPPWLVRAAQGVHVTLLVLLVLIPVTAIAGAWYEGHPLTLLSLDVAPPLSQSHRLGEWISTLHTWLGDAIMWVAGLHTAAALWHHFRYRDGVLTSMLPVPAREG